MLDEEVHALRSEVKTIGSALTAALEREAEAAGRHPRSVRPNAKMIATIARSIDWNPTKTDNTPLEHVLVRLILDVYESIANPETEEIEMSEDEDRNHVREMEEERKAEQRRQDEWAALRATGQECRPCGGWHFGSGRH